MSLIIKETEYVSTGGTIRQMFEAELRIPERDEEAPITVQIVPEPLPTDRLAALQKLVELSTDGDSLDWDLLARANVEAWGASADSE